MFWFFKRTEGLDLAHFRVMQSAAFYSQQKSHEPAVYQIHAANGFTQCRL